MTGSSNGRPLSPSSSSGGGGGSWGSITGTLSAQTDLQSALDGKAASSHAHSASDITSGVLAAARGGIGSGLTSGAIPYFDGTAAADSVLSQSAGVVVLASTSWINLSNAGAPSTSQFGIGAESGAVRVQSGSGGATGFYQGSTCGVNINGAAIAVGLGTTAASAPLHARNASGAQIIGDHSSGNQFSLRADASGHLTIAHSGDRLAIGGGTPTATANEAITVGFGAANSGAYSVLIGGQASCSGAYSVVVGRGASSNVSTAIAIGVGATATVANTCVIGASSYQIDTIWAGKGMTNATPTAWGIRGTGGSGTNVAGGDLYLDAGPGTGNAATGTGRLRATAAGSSGATPQSSWSDVLTWERGKIGFFGAARVAQAAYIASPTNEQIRDILINYGLMAAS